MLPAASKLFINYRRNDTEQAVAKLAAALKHAFGEAAVFLDTKQILLGRPYPQQLRQALDAASIVLVAIGPNWLKAADEHFRRRLDQETDWVRIEILHAINRGIDIIPLLIGGTSLPGANALPECLAKLTVQQGFRLSNAHWAGDRKRVAGVGEAGPHA